MFIISHVNCLFNDILSTFLKVTLVSLSVNLAGALWLSHGNPCWYLIALIWTQYYNEYSESCDIKKQMKYMLCSTLVNVYIVILFSILYLFFFIIIHLDISVNAI